MCGIEINFKGQKSDESDVDFEIMLVAT